MAGLSARYATLSFGLRPARTEPLVLLLPTSLAGDGDVFDALVGVPCALGGRDVLPGVLCPPTSGVEIVRWRGAVVGGENSVAEDVVMEVVRCVRGVAMERSSSVSGLGCLKFMDAWRESDGVRFELNDTLFCREGVLGIDGSTLGVVTLES